MEIENITLKITDIELSIIFDALENYITDETKQTMYPDYQDFLDSNKEEMELINDIMVDFNYEFYVAPIGENKSAKHFRSPYEAVKYLMDSK